MSKNKKWSEQILVEESLKVQDEAEKKINVLYVCNNGMNIYRKEFIEGKYKDKCEEVRYDFIVLAGVPCPQGDFYEVEYTIGAYGMVYRALIQCVNPVTDLQLVLGCLKRNNMLPEGFTVHEAFLSGIDRVHVGSCSKDDNGEAVICYGTDEPKPDEPSIRERVQQEGLIASSCCMEYYRGDVREIWIEPTDTFDPVFVCGSDNVNDEAFSKQRAADQEEATMFVTSLAQLLDKYKRPYIMAYYNIDNVNCTFAGNVKQEDQLTFLTHFINTKFEPHVALTNIINALFDYIFDILYADESFRSKTKADKVKVVHETALQIINEVINHNGISNKMSEVFEREEKENK